jgi:hypothetical protein
MAFLPRLRGLLDQAGVEARVHEVRVESDEATPRERFLGAPTLRIDGIDIDPGAGARRDYGLKCRLYQTAEGLQSMPPDAWVLDGLTRAAGERS